MQVNIKADSMYLASAGQNARPDPHDPEVVEAAPLLRDDFALTPLLEKRAEP
jgi:hypothetical protein